MSVLVNKEEPPEKVITKGKQERKASFVYWIRRSIREVQQPFRTLPWCVAVSRS